MTSSRPTLIPQSARRGSGLWQVCSRGLALLCLLVGVACAGNTASAPRDAPTTQVKMARLGGQPLEDMLPKLHPDHRSFVLDFAATVPDPLPALAQASVVMLEPGSPPSDGRPIVELLDGFAEVEVGIANPGSNTNQPNVVCLRNGEQVSCTPDVNVWEVVLPPRTLAFVPTRIPANRGDRLTFLLLARDDSKRVDIASQVFSAFVEKRPDLPSEFVEAPVHEAVLRGCDFATLVTDTSPTDTFRIPGTQKRGTELYLLIQLCSTTGREYMRFVPVADRVQVVDLPGDVWHYAVRLAGPVSVVPIDTGQLGPIHEFQVALVPLSDEATTVLRANKVTHAVAFSD